MSQYQQFADGIRQAYLVDQPDIVRLGYEALEYNLPPRQRISWRKLDALSQECILGEQNFAQVVVKGGRVQGALCALVHNQLVFERKQASVVQWYCKAPGEGVKLFRNLLSFCDKPGIKCVTFMPDMEIEPRIHKLLARLGMEVETVWTRWS